jgi:hypothetical protein
MRSRKEKGYQGRFYSIPPDEEADTKKDTPQAKKKCRR